MTESQGRKEVSTQGRKVEERLHDLLQQDNKEQTVSRLAKPQDVFIAHPLGTRLLRAKEFLVKLGVKEGNS